MRIFHRVFLLNSFSTNGIFDFGARISSEERYLLFVTVFIAANWVKPSQPAEPISSLDNSSLLVAGY